MSGPLQGVRVVEVAGIGAGPFCGMMLADMGADVVCVERPDSGRAEPDGLLRRSRGPFDVNARGKRQVMVDLNLPHGVEQMLSLVERADVLIEAFRPGVMERLGIGPEVCLARNPKLVFGRLTGWGQYGPLARAAGHDINHISITGMLGATGRPGEPPAPPLNLFGDVAGGGMMLAFGVACALFESRASGKGQVIDAAMTDGTALLGAALYGLKAEGQWSAQRGGNIFDGAAHFYDTYECADGRHISLGSIEPQFYAELLERLGIFDPAFAQQMNRRRWPELKRRLAAVFVTRTRAQWAELLEGTDACFTQVLDMDEAPRHAHNVARDTFIEIAGVTQPAPAPRFSRTVPEVRHAAGEGRTDVAAALAAWDALTA
jgi:alpha-methylacyl-CoA racemase